MSLKDWSILTLVAIIGVREYTHSIKHDTAEIKISTELMKNPLVDGDRFNLGYSLGMYKCSIILSGR